VNIYEIIEAANSQNYSHIHQPGISVGGHCIPIYPQFYLWNDKTASIVRDARKTNKTMPKYAIDQLGESIGNLKDLTILILGISYRSNVKETAFSGVFDLVKEIENRGANAVVSDPLYSDAEIASLGLHPYIGDASNIDAVVLHTNHRNFLAINFSTFSKCKAIYDGRNLLSNSELSENPIFISLGNKQIGV